MPRLGAFASYYAYLWATQALVSIQAPCRAAYAASWLPPSLVCTRRRRRRRGQAEITPQMHEDCRWERYDPDNDA